jgi:hypothetical protein
LHFFSPTCLQGIERIEVKALWALVTIQCAMHMPLQLQRVFNMPIIVIFSKCTIMSQGIERIEVKALWALAAIECAMLVFFLALAIALMWVPYMSACRQHRVSGGVWFNAEQLLNSNGNCLQAGSEVKKYESQCGCPTCQHAGSTG